MQDPASIAAEARDSVKRITPDATPTHVFSKNLDVEFIISFRYDNPVKAPGTGDKIPAEKQFEKLLRALDKAGLSMEVRDGGKGNLLIFVRVRSERKLHGEVYRSR